MNKWTILAGSLLAFTFLYFVQIGKIGMNDIFTAIDIGADLDSFEELDEHAYGAIIPSDSAVLRKFLLALEDEQTVDKIVVLGENHLWRGKDQIALFEDEGNYYAFSDEKWKDIAESEIDSVFPEVEKAFYSVKDIASEEVVESFSAELVEDYDRNTVVILLTDFSEDFSEEVVRFQEEYSNNIFYSFDVDGAKNLSVDSRVGVEILMKYLAEIEAMETSFTSNGTTVFYDGDSENDTRPLFMTAFGDMMLGRYVRTLMDSYGKDYIFENIAGVDDNFFRGTDVLTGNLEGPINGKGRSGGTSMVFSFNEDIARFLKKYGFDLLSISNNHALDQGWDGRDNTILGLEEAGIGWCGHPSEADGDSVYYGEEAGKTYAMLCFQDVTSKLDDEAAIALVKEVDEKVDFTFVSIHWGYEYKHSPDVNSQVVPGRAFVDAGADFIIGHHPHVVQSFEIYNDRFIFYSLGNFVFDQYWSRDTQEQLGLGIIMDKDDEDILSKVYLFPMVSEKSQPRSMTEAEFSKWVEEFISYGNYDEEMQAMIREKVVSTTP